MTSLLLISAFDPLPSDGVEVIRYPYLAKALTDAGVKVTYLTADFFHYTKRYREPDLEGEIDAWGMDVHYLPCPPYRRNIGFFRLYHHYRFGREVLRFLRENGANYDLILSAFPPIHVNYLLAKWAKRNGIPYFVDIQDLWPDAFVKKGLPRWLLRSFFRKRRYALQYARGVIAVSWDYLVALESEITSDLQRSFPLGLSPTVDEMEQNSAPSEFFTLVFLGASSQIPFLEELIRRWDELPKHYRLVLVGRSPLFKGKPSEPDRRIFYHYEVEEGEKQALLAQADVGLLITDPTLQSRFPNKAFSYMRAGLSLITNIRGGELEALLLTNKLGGVCADWEDFLGKLAEVEANRTDETRHRIKEFAVKQFSKEAIYTAYATFILDQDLS